MKFSYLNTKNIFDQYETSKRHTELLTDPFPEFERISRNKPHESIDNRYPKTTDGTTAAVIRKTPRRVVQKLPSGVVKSDDEDDWLPIVAQFIYTNKILEYANTEYDLLTKCWNILEKGLTFGSAATYTPFVNHDGYFCSDLTSPYWGDVFLQPGKKSGYDCNYVFLRSWWQKEDVEALIRQEKKLKKNAKKRGEEYESSWDLKALRKVLNSETMKDDQATTPAEEERVTNPTGIEFVTAFQEGVNAIFYTFNPGSKEIVRRKTNKDPRGKTPIDWMYADVDGSNPLGRGIVELVGGLQNLIDSDMQMYQYNRALMLNPPVIKRGAGFSKNQVVYEPGRIIDLGSSENANVEPLTIDTSAVTNYPNLYGLQKSQLLNLVGSPDSSISSESGNPSFSKTDSGVKQQEAAVSVDDNYVRKMFEKWFERWSETAINLYFAERKGVEELQLDKETADKLRELAQKGKFDETMLSEDNKIRIDYDTATPALRFRVDASTSETEDNNDKITTLQGLLETVQNSSKLQKIIPDETFVSVWNEIVSASGAEKTEELQLDKEQFKERQQQLQTSGDKLVEYKDAPEDVKRQMEQMDGYEPSNQVSPAQQEINVDKGELQHDVKEDENDRQLIQQLKSLGFSDGVTNEAVSMLDQGYSADQVLQSLAQQGGTDG